MPATLTVRVDAAAARARARAALAAHDPADADLAARAVVAGDASGWPEFGLALLVRELRDARERTATGRPGTRAPSAVVTGATATLDAYALPGPVALAAAVRRAAGLSR
ncbi:hypothetical protein, partial [Cellulosimicrobium funkei]|uniref:hypothetical protein n=1 Tax=Cellulosimicrobium funkei TaxID=264251 RepID=UPI0030F7A675